MASSAGSAKKFAWARLNSDGLFLALLAMASGAFDLINAQHSPETGALGFVPLTIYLSGAGFLIGGFLLLFSLLKGHIPTEVVGRSILLAAPVVEMIRHIGVFGWTNINLAADVVLIFILVATATVRFSVLFAKEGLTFTIPPNTSSEEWRG